MEKSESYLTAPEHRECYDGLKKSYALDQDFFYSYDVYTIKRGRKDKDKDEDPSAGSDRGLKRRKISKDADLTTEPKKKDSTSGTSIGTKSQPRSSRKSVQSEELVFEVANSDMPHDQEGNLGDHEDKPRQETSSRSDLFKKPPPTQEPTDPDWNVGKTNKEGGDYLFDLSKPLPLITRGKRQRVPYEFFINNDLKYLQGGILTMTYTTSTTKTKGISHWREQRKSFYAFKRGMQSRGDVYSTKRILAVTHVSVMRKYRYGYLEEIVVRRADNVLYRLKEGDFPRLRINDIEDMLLLMVQNRLNNLSGDDVADFAIALRIYTRSLFSDGTLTKLLSLLKDITKNIDMMYLPKRRWSTLEKKRAYFMIKDINELLKERKMMRSLEKFIGGRLYRTDLRLLQRTI
ncbi:hypothetical protein Tco_1095609 [Tanacetum coccineum]